MHDDSLPSRDQVGWEALARKVRRGLSSLADDLGAMDPAEAKTLVEACQAGFWLAHNAALWDKKLQLELARVTAAD